MGLLMKHSRPPDSSFPQTCLRMGVSTPARMDCSRAFAAPLSSYGTTSEAHGFNLIALPLPFQPNFSP